jgi:hypothetical protein
MITACEEPKISSTSIVRPKRFDTSSIMAMTAVDTDSRMTLTVHPDSKGGSARLTSA